MQNLDDRITFLVEEDLKSDNGLPTGNKQELPFYTCWGSFKRLKKNETISVRVRYCKKAIQIDKTLHKVKVNNEVYLIDFHEIVGNKQYIDFTCKEVG